MKKPIEKSGYLCTLFPLKKYEANAELLESQFTKRAIQLLINIYELPDKTQIFLGLYSESTILFAVNLKLNLTESYGVNL